MYLENLYSDDLDTELFIRECFIDIEESSMKSNQYLDYYNESVMFESEDDAQDGVLRKICNKIREIIEKIGLAISSFFKSIHMNIGEQLSVSDYMTSDDAKIKLSADYEKIVDEIDKEILSRHKIVSKLAKMTGVSPRAVKNITDHAQQVVIDNAPTVMTVTSGVLLANKISKTFLKGDQVRKDINDLNKKVNKELKRKRNLRTQILRDQGHEFMALLNEQGASLGNLMNKLMRGSKEVTKELNKFKK